MSSTEPSSVRLAGTLGLAGLISGLVLVGIYLSTLPMIQANQAEALKGVPSEYQLALRHVFAEWGVARSTKKAIERCFVMPNRGARLDDGRLGRATPSTDKLVKFIGVTWMLLGDAYITWQDVAAVGGSLCSFSNFAVAPSSPSNSCGM